MPKYLYTIQSDKEDGCKYTIACNKTFGIVEADEHTVVDKILEEREFLNQEALELGIREVDGFYLNEYKIEEIFYYPINKEFRIDYKSMALEQEAKTKQRQKEAMEEEILKAAEDIKKRKKNS